MKNQMFNLIKVVTLAAILAVGVSAVSAFTGPATLIPPNGPETSVPADVSSTPQNKVGGFVSALFLKSGIAHPFALSGAAAAGWVIAEDKIISPWSFSTKTFLPGNTSQMKIGSASDTSDPFTDATFPLTIDLVGRGTSPDPKGRDAIEFLADTNFCNTKTTVVTNTPTVQFWSTKNDDNADLIARQIQLNAGNPAKDKVLISTDTDGNATWASVRVRNGAIEYYGYQTTPVSTNICQPSEEEPEEPNPSVGGAWECTQQGWVPNPKIECLRDGSWLVNGTATGGTFCPGPSKPADYICRFRADLSPEVPAESCESMMARTGNTTCGV